MGEGKEAHGHRPVRSLAMTVWDALYSKQGEYVFDPHQSTEWNRGAFLVDGPAHCGACQTPKTFLGGDKMSM